MTYYFLTPPESRTLEDMAMSVDRVKAALEALTIYQDTPLYPEGGSSYVLAGQLNPAPPPLPGQTPLQTSLVQQQPATPKKGSAMKWVLLGIGILGVIALLIVGAIFGGIALAKQSEMAVLSDIPIQEERLTHETEWIENDEYEPDGTPDVPDGKILNLVRYPAADGEHAAYLTPDPGDGKKHPVMIWSKGGFGGIGRFLWSKPSRLNDQSARAFREAGIVLMCPSFRGENDNKGRFELFFGEIDDFLAAVEYAKKLPYVDPKRVYIGGHSTGGTVSLLAATSGIECRGVFSFGGAPNMEEVMADGEGYDNTPYDIDSTIDHQLRSAIRYTKFIKSPTYYIEGGNLYDYNNSDAKKMERLANHAEVPFSALTIPDADHFDILTSSTRLIAQKILDDSDETPITLTEEELKQAWQKLNGISLTSELSRWIRKGGELKPILENLETDIEVTTQSEITLIKKAVAKCIKEGADKDSNIAELAEICDRIEDEDLERAFIKRLSPDLHTYIKPHLQGEKRSEQIESNCMRIAGSLALANDPKIPPIVSNLATAQVAPQDDNWDYMFEAIEEQTVFGKAIVLVFQKTPPIGEVGENLLATVNNVLIDDSEVIPIHPYDSPEGANALSKMIDENGDQAFQATLALAFIDEARRKKLLPKAFANPRHLIRMEAAWVDARHRGATGIKYLQDACLDLAHSTTAKNYLEELDLEDKIPAASRKPAFVAKATMVNWLKHPNELGTPPLSIEEIDQRTLYWPPIKEEAKLRLFKFTYQFKKDKVPQTSYGMVGARTWSSFTAYPKNPGIPKLYGHYCALELRGNAIRKGREEQITDQEGLKLLEQRNPGAFSGSKD